MPETKVPSQYAVVKKGVSCLLKLLTRIKARGPGQVLVLGAGVGAYYNEKERIPSILGNEWTPFVPPYAPTRQQNEEGIMQFSKLIQENAHPARVGFFMAHPEFVSERLFLPSKTGPYPASIYILGLSSSPLNDMETYRTILARPHIQAPWVETIFCADDNKLRKSEQDEISQALEAHSGLNQILPRVLRSLQEEFAALEARNFAESVKKINKKWWEFWR
jgi:hypothetical protein